MITIDPRHEHEIYIQLVPSVEETLALSRGRVSSTSQEPTRAYDARVYTHMTIPGLTRAGDPSLPIAADVTTSLPLAGLEHVVVKWSKYQDYLAHFLEGTREPERMRDNLFKTLSPGLQRLFGGEKLSDSRLRVWWRCKTPELEDLPWELLAYGRRRGQTDLSFVRGRPPATPVPRIPVSGPLRLACIRPPNTTHSWLMEVMSNLSPGIQVTHMTEQPRQALEMAARDEFELVHLVADGVVSLAYEGILYLHDSTPPEFSAQELSACLSGSRVGVLALTEPDTSNLDVVQIGRYQVPSAFRAFACLSRSTLPLPNIVAPLGPGFGFDFWRRFYTTLSESLKVEVAMLASQASDYPYAAALFLRQSHQRTFHRLEAEQATSVENPNQINADLQRSRQMLSALEDLRQRYGDFPASLQRFVTAESARQSALESKLDPWLQSETEE